MILDSDDVLVGKNQALLDSQSVFEINIMASPESAKKRYILESLKRLSAKTNSAVIEGDTAPDVDGNLIRTIKRD